MAKPSGTLTPFAPSALNISPRDAFLPPTDGISAMPISANDLMNAECASCAVIGAALGCTVAMALIEGLQLSYK
jgi:hypothetical protein